MQRYQLTSDYIACSVTGWLDDDEKKTLDCHTAALMNSAIPLK